ncbi:MAG: hypothetical protein AB7P17_15925 [Nitrospirales bacterium]|nr:hypothetical protein [Nitrospirales bacterium]
MDFQVDFIFRSGAGYDDLVALIQANPRYVFGIWKQDKIDKRTTKSRDRGWVEIKHKQHSGVIKLSKRHGVCRASITDTSGGLKLIGPWTSWLGSNAPHLISGLDLRFE